MSGITLAQIGLPTLVQSPISWGLAISALGLWAALGSRNRRLRRLGQFIAPTGLVVLAIALPKLSQLSNFDQWVSQITFWLLAAVAVVCSAAAVIARNPVYTAIWFAGSLLGVAGLFLFQNAQFLGFATVVVYAGAIVVTFLFVLMLANPEGHAQYDRVSWATFPAPLTIFASAVFVLITATAFLTQPPSSIGAGQPVQSEQHVAPFGGELFAKHLVSVEVAGTILLVALVGTIAMVIQSKGEPGGPPSMSEAASARETS